MTIKVTYKGQNKTIRRDYTSHKRAIGEIKRWFVKNHGLVMVYQPDTLPQVYSCISQLPAQTTNKQTNFYNTRAWRELRLEVLAAVDNTCVICGHGRKHGAVLHVDHIKPRSKYPELALNRSNLRILCEDCNVAKLDKEETIIQGVGGDE